MLPGQLDDSWHDMSSVVSMLPLNATGAAEHAIIVTEMVKAVRIEVRIEEEDRVLRERYKLQLMELNAMIWLRARRDFINQCEPPRRFGDKVAEGGGKDVRT